MVEELKWTPKRRARNRELGEKLVGRKDERERSRESGVCCRPRGSAKNKSSTLARRQQEKQEEKGVENS